MSRYNLILAGVVGIVVLLSAVVLKSKHQNQNAASNDPQSQKDESGAEGDGHAASHIGAAVEIWKEWPKPQLALLVTGEQHGYFEPCGCTSNQLGGMSRRADLNKKLTDAGWAVRGVDLGGLARRSGRQAQIKFETTLAGLRQLNYIATGIGPEDLRLQPDFLLSQHIVDGDHPLHFLSANLVFYGTPELGTPVASVISEQAGVRLGITSVLSESLRATVIPEGANTDITWSEPAPALQKVLSEFDSAEVDLRILLSHGSVEESEELARQFPAFDIVVTAEGPEDPSPSEPPQMIGTTQILKVGRKGKHVGVLGIYPDDAEQKYRFQLVSLERDNFDETDSMIQLMRSYQERLKDEQIVLADAEIAYPSGATFVGSEKCGECHTTAFEIWKDSGHAHALESLDPVHQRVGFERLNGVARMFDPECLSCHVTGWESHEYLRFRSGFLNSEFAGSEQEKQLHTLLAGSGCENCHGPGSHHIELIESDQIELARKEVHVTLQQAKDTVCYKCHDNDNSPHFDFDEYWDKVKHEGLD